MHSMANGLLKLFLLLLAAVLLGELLQADYSPPESTIQHSIGVACQSMGRTFELLFKCRWGELQTVEGGLWVLQNKAYYLVLVLAGLVGYFKWRGDGLARPEVAVAAVAVRAGDYEREKAENTRREVEKLERSPQYQEYRRRMMVGDYDDDGTEEEDPDWEEAERRIYDD